jgi:hypothetical protein
MIAHPVVREFELRQRRKLAKRRKNIRMRKRVRQAESESANVLQSGNQSTQNTRRDRTAVALPPPHQLTMLFALTSVR